MSLAPRDGRERWGSHARGDAGVTWTGVFMALLLGAGAGVLAFGASFLGLRWFGCPASLVKALAVLAGLVVGGLVTLRVLWRQRRGDDWRDSGGGIGIASGLGDVIDVIDVFTD